MARYLRVARYPEVLGDDLGEVEAVRLGNDFEQLPWVADSEVERFAEALVCLAEIPFHRCEVLFDPIGTLVGPLAALPDLLSLVLGCPTQDFLPMLCDPQRSTCDPTVTLDDPDQSPCDRLGSAA